MGNFERITEVLFYIDGHLEERLTLDFLAKQYHFSPYYFHRIFTLIVGQPVAEYIRERRLLHACKQLSATDLPVIQIGLACGFQYAQAFSRAFKLTYGLSPTAYRAEGLVPEIIPIDKLIQKLTNRLRGGLYVNPKLITRGRLCIAGISGDGDKTGEVWDAFEKLHEKLPLENRASQGGYEIRLYNGIAHTVHVGYDMMEDTIPEGYTVFKLAASKYASFDVYVENGYGSENQAMNTWLESNQDGYREKLLGDAHYCVEYYDERFQGSETGSIVEIWIPIEKDECAH